MLHSMRLSSIGAVCAILVVVCFVAGSASMASSGVQVLIPETGQDGHDWIADVDSAGALFFVGAWLIILMGFLAIVALVTLYDVVREAGPAIVLAPILAAVGLTLVTVSHLIPIALAYQFVPAYTDAGPAGQETLDGVFDTFASTALVTNTAGNFLGWGVALPLYSLAIIVTRALPRWIGWLGLAVAVLAGWVGLLGPASSVIESIASLGFIGFFVFMLSLGVALLRRRATAGGVETVMP